MEKNRPVTKVTEEYRTAVTALADNKENRRFLNDSSDHAKLLADLMIGRAKKGEEVLIYSGAMRDGCFVDALKSFKGTARILLDSSDGLGVINGFSKEICERIQAQVLEKRDGNHFFVAGASFRYEMDHNDATAIANFNEPATVEKLKDRFESLWKPLNAG